MWGKSYIIVQNPLDLGIPFPKHVLQIMKKRIKVPIPGGTLIRKGSKWILRTPYATYILSILRDGRIKVRSKGKGVVIVGGNVDMSSQGFYIRFFWYQLPTVVRTRSLFARWVPNGYYRHPIIKNDMTIYAYRLNVLPLVSSCAIRKGRSLEAHLCFHDLHISMIIHIRLR